ncbi:iron complex transport system substrate-binding protein [Paenibacillus tianmuensis]|uniref:Iron complex transport system substrate-binding protein n=1 Tax=Paenibacillus tianmuensis TaxID=624147 RepID=A0A1G4RZ54_9BACL|nr:ABC transporter substrate-binding protein [Paenibacillus tianmuensis]SCW62332.1 iron complex transport system substrate-binding protein [Paenibacillus tianmuensis]
MVLLAVVFLSACGSDKAVDGGSSPAASSTPESTPAPASSTSSAETGNQENAASTRTVSTVNGDVEIPAQPKRIVALYYHHILLALGESPVGANLTWWGGSPFLKDLESGIKDVGGPPSLEAVTALEPDLIIMNSQNAEDYEQFSKIAPSLLIPYDGNRSVYEDAKLLAEMLGKPDAADQLTADFEKKAAEARAKLGGVLDGDVKAAIIRIDSKGGQFTVFGDNYGRGGWSIYKGLQMQYPAKIKEAVVDSGKQIVQELSLEQLTDFVQDADYLFVSNEGFGLDVVKDSSVWKSLPAVKENRVIELDGKQYFYFDPISISAQLDLIVDLLQKHQAE